ncbi:uncharacterized protein LOC111031561 [Myzus persicae]|uniref:uncharacterized protein LOC111031561 n=1 Tax=Myzus persicae TaxID=13164 RepID=UPI000B93723A|nr:uncharacterized protein LOC111031561 [Myzus persicae]
MHVKIAVVLFAVATLLQPSHSIPTHRYARDSPDWASRFKEYMNKIPGYGGGASESPKPPSSNQPDSSSYQQGAAAGTESASASAPEASIAAKDGASPPSTSGFSSYMPNMQNYQNMIPSGMSSYYPSQMPQSMNPSGFMGSIPGSSGSAGSASAPEASIAAKDGASPPSTSGFSSYMPNMQTYQNMIPSGMSSYYPSQMPQSMNPSGYLGSKPTGS